MGIRPCIVAALMIACGKVDTVVDGPPAGRDGPACTACVANGQVCDADSQCTSGTCSCHDATCATKVCSATACACQSTSAGTTCDGELAAGAHDASCASGCDGTGACATPLLWFKLDEAAGAGTVANSGTWPGTATVAGTQGATGITGKALQLAQAADGITIADPADGSLDNFAAWTVEGWINMSTLPLNGYATLEKKDPAYICRIAQATGMYYDQSIVSAPGQPPTNYIIPTGMTVGTWYHIACSYSTGALIVYFNGSKVATTAGGTGAIADTASPLLFGHGTNTENLVGLLDDVKMWTTARTDRQVCLDACGSYTGTTCTFDGVCGN
jgi:hypothetical protein